MNIVRKNDRMAAIQHCFADPWFGWWCQCSYMTEGAVMQLGSGDYSDSVACCGSHAQLGIAMVIVAFGETTKAPLRHTKMYCVPSWQAKLRKCPGCAGVSHPCRDSVECRLQCFLRKSNSNQLAATAGSYTTTCFICPYTAIGRLEL